MLAYTVWHHASDESKLEHYQNSLIQFHQTMAEEKPQGYISSKLFTMPSVPWMGETQTIFMDWYLIEDSASLDPLNDSVLAGTRKTSHDAVADNTSGGVTALYQPKLGNDQISNVNFITWVSKPKGMKYPNFFQELNFILHDKDASCWMRYMALGPGPEFCVVANHEMEWDEKFQPLVRKVDKIWG